eukprot:SAG31_NODE_4282_length_3381_cov_2.153870_4_plen_120_part_00
MAVAKPRRKPPAQFVMAGTACDLPRSPRITYGLIVNPLYCGNLGSNDIRRETAGRVPRADDLNLDRDVIREWFQQVLNLVHVHTNTHIRRSRSRHSSANPVRLVAYTKFNSGTACIPQT